MGSPSATKSNAIRRLLFCFRPNVAHDDDDVSPFPTMNPHRLTTKDAVAAADLLASIAVQEKERFVLPGASLPAREPGPDDNADLPRKESSKRFSKIMKAVKFENSLSKKMRKRKNSSKSSPTTEDEPSAETTPHSTAEESSESDNGGGGAGPTPSSSSSSGSLTETCTTDSPSSSFTIGSSSSMSGSSFPSISRTTSLQIGKSFEATPEEPPKQPPSQPRIVTNSRHSDSIGYQCLFLLSLAALIFFGKACAIFCTSVCFYFVPRLSRPRRDRSPPPSKAACLHIDTEDIRRRVEL